MNTQPRPAPEPAPLLIRALRVLGPGLLFAVLTIVMTWPLATDPAHSIISGITADADVSRWDLWWLKTALLDHHSNPFYTDLLYYPYRTADHPLPLYYHTLQPLNGLLALPILLLTDAMTGPTLAFNLLVLGHFIATGWAMYALVRYLTGSVTGGLVAGTLFTFSPFHQYHLHEAQLELIPLEWAPLFLLFLHRLLYAPPGSRRRDALLAAGGLIAASYTSWYWALYLLLAGAGLTLWRILVEPKTWRRAVQACGAVLLGWVVVTGPFLWATARAANDPTFELVSGLDYEVRFSLNPLDLIWVAKDTRLTPAVWFMGTLGLSTLLLSALGVFKRRPALGGIRKSDSTKNETAGNDPSTDAHSALHPAQGALFWLALALAGAVLALGPYLNLNDAQDVAHSTGIPLPYLLVRNLPFLSIARVPRRFALLANLGLDILAGAGAAYLTARARDWAARWGAQAVRVATVAATLVLLAWPLAEFAVLPQPLHPVVLSPFFSRLAAEPGARALLELPITTHYLRDHQRMLYQTVHGKPIIGGYVARRVYDYYLDDSDPFFLFRDLTLPLTRDILPPLSPIAVLNYYDMPYLVAYKDDESYIGNNDREEVLAYTRRLFPDPTAVVQDDAQLTAYRVPTLPQSGPLAWAGNGWYAPEGDATHSWRWSSAADAHLFLLGKAPAVGPLRFRAATLQGTAHLTVTVNGQPLDTVRLGPGEQSYDLGTLQLPAGLTTLNFHSDQPAQSPPGGGRDQRPLGFLLTAVQLPGLAK